MVLKIEKDHQRFRQIVKGRIREDLRKFLTKGELIGKEGKHLISIPVRGIELPHFRYGDNSRGVGVGSGEEGDAVGKPGQGKGQGGTEAGQHLMEVDLSLDELAEILAEELKLPRIEPKGHHRITTVREKYSSLRRVGPESLRHFKRSYREALKRQIMTGDYDPDNPVIVPEKKDIRYRSWKEVKSPQSNALIVFMMDVSGSMGEEQKELVRLESFWIDTWLRKNYEGIESRYIVHDVSAKEVDKQTFYHLREDGGTKISSAYRAAKQLLDSHYSPEEWNIYLFHFSDGDNSSEADSRDCVKILKEQLLPACNMFGYCQVASAYGSGNFINVLHEQLRKDERVLTSRVNSKDDIYDSIKTFFGKGRSKMSSHTLAAFPDELLAAKKQIREQAGSYGLDFYPTIFEMCDYEQMNQIAAYGGFPQRYPHWRFGAEYEGLRKRHHYGLGRIYEMVINNDPCYAYLQESNALVDQKLVMAHVYGHCDFFKNNLWFGKTNRKMMDEMANHATRIRRHIEKHGYDAVEHFLDVCLSLEHLIDPHSMFLNRGPVDTAHVEPKRQEETGKFKAKDYMDRWVNPPAVIEAEQKKRRDDAAKQRLATPAHPTRDVLLYLLQHARLEDWQIDCLSIVREESYYFAPQAMTKVMNEGWASYWHSTLMTKHFLDAKEVIDYADHHSGTVHMPPGNFNPYKIGIELFRDIEDRWNKGKFGKEYEESDNLGEKKRWDKGLGLGREKIFEVRRVYNDVNFIDEFMTPEFIEKHKFYQYGRDPHTGQVRILSRDPHRIKQTLLYQLTNMGQPFIYVADGNYCNRGELYLAHKHNGPDIEIKFAVETLRNIHKLWGRPVHLQARIDDEMTLFTYAGDQPRQQAIHDDLPPPAHRVE